MSFEKEFSNIIVFKGTVLIDVNAFSRVSIKWFRLQSTMQTAQLSFFRLLYIIAHTYVRVNDTLQHVTLCLLTKK